MSDKNKRRLTTKEQLRAEKVGGIIAHKEKEGYKQTNITISIVKANVFAAVVGVIGIILSVALYYKIHGSFTSNYGWKFVLFLMLSFVIHELIHGLFWGLFASEHYKSIEFGFIVQMLTPYCTCLEPLKKWQYLVGCIMPGVILGLFPFIAAYIIGSTIMLIYGLVMLVGAVGDIMIVIKLLRFKSESKDVIYIDHPTEGGLIALEKIS